METSVSDTTAVFLPLSEDCTKMLDSAEEWQERQHQETSNQESMKEFEARGMHEAIERDDRFAPVMRRMRAMEQRMEAMEELFEDSLARQQMRHDVAMANCDRRINTIKVDIALLKDEKDAMIVRSVCTWMEKMAIVAALRGTMEQADSHRLYDMHCLEERVNKPLSGDEELTSEVLATAKEIYQLYTQGVTTAVDLLLAVGYGVTREDPERHRDELDDLFLHAGELHPPLKEQIAVVLHRYTLMQRDILHNPHYEDVVGSIP
jgi:DNA-binding protein YbaB